LGPLSSSVMKLWSQKGAFPRDCRNTPTFFSQGPLVWETRWKTGHVDTERQKLAQWAEVGRPRGWLCRGGKGRDQTLRAKGVKKAAQEDAEQANRRERLRTRKGKVLTPSLCPRMGSDLQEQDTAKPREQSAGPLLTPPANCQVFAEVTCK
jgi:hypothetical protein